MRTSAYTPLIRKNSIFQEQTECVSQLCLFSPQRPRPPLPLHRQRRLIRASRAATSSTRADGRMCICKARRSRSAFSMDICWRTRLKTTFRSTRWRRRIAQSASGASFATRQKNVLWPHLDAEYQQELKGIVEGLHAQGAALDLWDIVALNGYIELSDYYMPRLNAKEGKTESASRPLLRANAARLLPRGRRPRAEKL